VSQLQPWDIESQDRHMQGLGGVMRSIGQTQCGRRSAALMRMLTVEEDKVTSSGRRPQQNCGAPDEASNQLGDCGVDLGRSSAHKEVVSLGMILVEMRS